jgi:hypothetical protein
MIDIDTTRINPDEFDGTIAYVATGDGLTVVRLSPGCDEEFAKVRCGGVVDVDVRDRLCFATAEDVFLFDPSDGTISATSFGSASAVTLADGGVLAGGDDGRVARYHDGNWSILGTVEDVRAIDRNLVGTRDGVYRIVGGSLASTDLNDVRDLSATGRPLVATTNGLYYLGPGWATAVEGSFVAVSTDGERAYAATEDTLYGRIDDEWGEMTAPASTPIVDIDHVDRTYAVSTDGVVCVECDDGWRTLSIGSDVNEISVTAVER